VNIFSDRASRRVGVKVLNIIYKQIKEEASYDFFRSKILKFLALADGATQRASRLAKRGKGGLGDVDLKKFNNFTEKDHQTRFFCYFFQEWKKVKRD